MESLDNLSISTIFDAFHYHSHNESYAIPGLYDLKVEDASWIFAATLSVFTMQTGLALLEVGIVSSKHRVNVMMKNIVDMCAGGFGFWLFGFGLMYGRGELTNGLFGAGDFFVDAKLTDPLMAQVLTFYFFQMSFATTSASIVSGAIAERCKFDAYILISFSMTIVYGIGAGWIWGNHGWLRNIGVIDFSGAGPVHIIGGAASLASAWYIKPRIGRFDKTTEPLPLSDGCAAVTGMFILWWGWIAFNSGSSYGITDGKWEFAARAGAGTTLASISSGLTAIIFSMIKHKGKVDVLEVLTGVLSGLVAINAGCYMFSMYSAVVVGFVAAILSLTAGPIIDNLKIDDAVGAVATHLVGGIWGQLSVGLFADPPTGPKGIFLGGKPYLLIVQAISSLSLTVWAATAMLLIMYVVNSMVQIRLDPEDEIKGCDLTEHYVSKHHSTETQKPSVTLDKIINITTPIAQRFVGSIENRNRLDFDKFRNKNFHINEGFERDNDKF